MDILSFFTSPEVRSAMVVFAYLCATAAFIVMIYHGFKYKTYGMPPLSNAAALGFTVIVGFYGPWSDQSHLFPIASDPHFGLKINLWRLWAVLMTIVLIQYFMWSKHHRSIWSNLEHYHLPFFLNSNVLFVLMLISLALGEWFFIVFYQDYYVNEICPIVMLFIAIGYLGTLFIRPKLLGLSLFVAWAWAISNLFLYVAVVLGPMDGPYPNATHGYGFIYWVYVVTIILNFLYVYLLTLRRKELQVDFHEDQAALTPMEKSIKDFKANV